MDIQVAYLPEDKFDYLKYKMNALRGAVIADDPVAMAIRLGEHRWVILRDFVLDLPDWKSFIILAHEAGHLELDEWKDEEKVDLWALEALEEMGQERSIKYLKSLWKERHGHEFTERKMNG